MALFGAYLDQSTEDSNFCIIVFNNNGKILHIFLFLLFFLSLVEYTFNFVACRQISMKCKSVVTLF